MRILKAKNIIRYYFKDNSLYLHGELETYKIKINEDDYLEIHNMLSQLRNGLDEGTCYETYKRYSKLLDFLTAKRFLYQIDKEILKQHSAYEYYSWLEKGLLSTEENLNKLSRFTIMCPKFHVATPSFEKKCIDNNLKCQIGEEIDSFQLWEDNRCISSYLPYLNEENEIVVAPHEPDRQKAIDRSNIAGKIISPFIFHALIMSAFEEYKTVFIIKDNLEVLKKKKFHLKRTSQRTKTVSKTDDDVITSLNALEKFLQTHHSEVSSFNFNKNYNDYLQLPIQIFTIQKKSRNNDDNNYYIADVNYERLAKFAVEVLFNEVLLGDHSQGISIVQESEIVHRIKKRVGNQTDGLKTLDISGVPEFEMINGLLEKEDLELTFMVDIPKSNGLKFYLRDDSTNKWYKFDYPIYNKEFIPLIIYTWISAYINEVPLHEAAFSQIEDKRNYLVDSIGFNDLKIETQQKSTKTDYLNINNILEDLGYGYEIMEG